MRTWITSRLTFPFANYRVGISNKKIRELIELEYKSRDHIKNKKIKNLKHIVKRGYENSKIYRSYMDDLKIKPEDIKTLSDITLLPIIEKEDVRRIFNELSYKVEKNKSLYINQTGGSTGKPLKFIQNEKYFDYGRADLIRHYHYTGWEIGQPYAFFWGAERDSPVLTLKGKIYSKLKNFRWLNSFSCTEEQAISFLRKISSDKVKLLVGYASSLHLLSKLSLKNDLQINLPAVESSAEQLTEWMRKDIEQEFQTKVFDRYGCREVGNIAHECNEFNGYHTSNLNIVEITNENGEPVSHKEEGYVLVTNLTNDDFPFIRYRNGDMAVANRELINCNCGRNLQIDLLSIKGRITDNFLFEDKHYVHGEYFTHLFYPEEGIEEFLVEQDSKNSIIIWYTKSGNERVLDEKKFIKEIHTFLPTKIEIQFKEVESIPRNETGKYRFTKSKYVKFSDK